MLKKYSLTHKKQREYLSKNQEKIENLLKLFL
nr:MAG TPA: hypothetical protein [Caudoviricetes sp.]